MAHLSILQIGGTDWTDQIQTDALDWHYTTSLDLPVLLARQQDPSFLAYTYVLLTDPVIDSLVIARQVQDWPMYRVIYLGDLQNFNPELQQALQQRGAFYFEEKTTDEVSERILRDLYLGQAGFPTRFSEDQFVPVTNYGWHLERTGRFSVQLSGDFGKDFVQVGTLKTYPGDFIPGQENLIYFDYQRSEQAEVALCFVFYNNGNLQQMQMLQGKSIDQVTAIKAPAKYQDYQILVLAKGHGTLDMHNVHQRKSRHGLGYFLPGGQRDLTEDGQEVLSYFNRGGKKGPLVVLFAGTRLHVEGFEMMGPLADIGYPRLLFTDPRAQGGAFMVGNEDYEALVTKKIEQARQDLGLEKNEVIFVGYSMGSYPAMYYAGKIGASHLVLAKPIINLGTFTAQGEFAHRGQNYDWPLDVRYILTGRLDLAATKQLDGKLWPMLDQISWTNAAVSLFTMDQDHYDGQSLGELLAYLDDHHVNVHRLRQSGLHEEKVDEMINFLSTEIKQQARKIQRGEWN